MIVIHVLICPSKSMTDLLQFFSLPLIYYFYSEPGSRMLKYWGSRVETLALVKGLTMAKGKDKI